NKSFTNRQLRGVMETSQRSFLSWLTGAGALDKKKLQEDIDHISAFYYDNGFLNVQVSQPQITRTGNSITILIAIDEGEAYRFGPSTTAGNLSFPRHELTALLTIKPGQRFEGAAMQHNVLVLSDFYSNRGYAFVNVDPKTRLEPQQHRINVTFYLTPGHEGFIYRYLIAAST